MKRQRKAPKVVSSESGDSNANDVQQSLPIIGPPVVKRKRVVMRKPIDISMSDLMVPHVVPPLDILPTLPAPVKKPPTKRRKKRHATTAASSTTVSSPPHYDTVADLDTTMRMQDIFPPSVAQLLVTYTPVDVTVPSSSSSSVVPNAKKKTKKPSARHDKKMTQTIASDESCDLPSAAVLHSSNMLQKAVDKWDKRIPESTQQPQPLPRRSLSDDLVLLDDNLSLKIKEDDHSKRIIDNRKKGLDATAKSPLPPLPTPASPCIGSNMAGKSGSFLSVMNLQIEGNLIEMAKENYSKTLHNEALTGIMAIDRKKLCTTNEDNVDANENYLDPNKTQVDYRLATDFEQMASQKWLSGGFIREVANANHMELAIFGDFMTCEQTLAQNEERRTTGFMVDADGETDEQQQQQQQQLSQQTQTHQASRDTANTTTTVPPTSLNKKDQLAFKLPKITATQIRSYLRAPIPGIDRPCAFGNACVSIKLHEFQMKINPLVPKHATTSLPGGGGGGSGIARNLNSNPSDWILREFLKPEQENQYITNMQLGVSRVNALNNIERQMCILCNRYYTTYRAALTAAGRADSPHTPIHDHQNLFGHPGQYPNERRLSFPSGDCAVIGDFVTFNANDYAPCSRRVQYLKTIAIIGENGEEKTSEVEESIVLNGWIEKGLLKTFEETESGMYDDKKQKPLPASVLDSKFSNTSESKMKKSYNYSGSGGGGGGGGGGRDDDGGGGGNDGVSGSGPGGDIYTHGGPGGADADDGLEDPLLMMDDELAGIEDENAAESDEIIDDVNVVEDDQQQQQQLYILPSTRSITQKITTTTTPIPTISLNHRRPLG